MASAERKTPALRVNMKKEAHAFLTNANPAKFGKTVNASPKNVLTVRTRLMENVPANANAKKVQNNGLRALVPLFPPFVMMAV